MSAIETVDLRHFRPIKFEINIAQRVLSIHVTDLSAHQERAKTIL